jgi:hypothetical protein
VALGGLTETATGTKLTVALPDALPSPTLAVTVTGCALAMMAGAVYSPLIEMLPTLGLIDHATPKPGWLTLAVNCWVCPPVSVTLGGLTVTVNGGTSVTVALPDWKLSATLVAVTVTDCWPAMLPGAVYSPLEEMLPTLGLSDQVTAVLVVPVTVAVNCWVPPGPSVTLSGLTETAMARLTVKVAGTVTLVFPPLNCTLHVYCPTGNPISTPKLYVTGVVGPLGIKISQAQLPETLALIDTPLGGFVLVMETF